MSDKYIQYFMAISRTRYDELLSQNAFANEYTLLQPRYRMEQEAPPILETVLHHAGTIGRPLDQHLYHQFNNKASLDIIADRLQKSSAQHYSFWIEDIKFGESILADVGQHIKKILKAYNHTWDPALNEARNPREIYQFGTLPEVGTHLKQSWALQIVSEIFTDKAIDCAHVNFRAHHSIDHIGFYSDIGMSVVHAQSYQELKPSN